MTELNKRTVWNKTYKGVGYTVNHWRMDSVFSNKDCWTYYLFIDCDRIPDAEKANALWLEPRYDEKGRCHYDYCADGFWLQGLEWHCGITWYSKESSVDERRRLIKVGCDYQHYWDEGNYYDEKYLAHDAERTIDQFLMVVPNYKRHCPIVGGYWLPEEGVVNPENGSFISLKGIEWCKENSKDWKDSWWNNQPENKGGVKNGHIDQ